MASKKRPHAASHRSGSGQGADASPGHKSASATATIAAPPRPVTPPLAGIHLDSEWLETDGRGGFASGTVSGIRTRRAHALLLVANPSGARIVLVNGFDARITTPHGAYDLTSHRYASDVIHPDGHRRIESFSIDPWPTWLFHLDDGTHIEQQLFCVSDAQGVIITWRVVGGSPIGVTLNVRPLISGREAHALHHENPHLHAEAVCSDFTVQWHPYASLPAILAGSNGSYTHHPFWYRSFIYERDRELGLDHKEDLHSPGTFRFDLSRGEAVLVFTTEEGLREMGAHASAHVAGLPGFIGPTRGDPEGALDALREGERATRADFPSPLHRAADMYLVQRGDRKSLVTGYPTLRVSDRETFAALRGICLAAGRLEEARQILTSWVPTLSQGMLPATFPLGDAEPIYDSVDAPLWFVIASNELIRAASEHRRRVSAADRNMLRGATEAILSWYVEGTRHRIRMDEDGLLAAGEPEVRLTWMDRALGAPPRIGKAVEVQALWLNALHAAMELSPRWEDLYRRGCASFERRFWNEETGCLYDVVDAGHVRGATDPTIRPFQILAVGGLPVSVINGGRSRVLVDLVEKQLVTAAGLRAGPADDTGAPMIAWPWLLGPFADAWVRVRGGTQEAKNEARERFLTPLLARTGQGGLGHLPEAADPDPPHIGRRVPFDAWSVGEALRLDQVILATP